MASQFKNRLVGVTILVALVVIFLPALIDGKKDAYQQEFVATPIKPESRPHSKGFPEAELQEEKLVIDEDENVQPQQLSSEGNGEWKIQEIPETTQPKTVQSITDTKPKPKTQQNKIKKAAAAKPAWTIQLGAFQNKANIISLMKKLNKAGFQVHTVPQDIVDGQLTRVFVGPDVSKKKLNEKLPRLKRLTGLNGKLVEFNPLQP